MGKLRDEKRKFLRLGVAAVLALGLLWTAKSFITESGGPFGEKIPFPEPPEKLQEVLGAVREAIPAREGQDEDEEGEGGIRWVLPEVAERTKEKIIERPKELVREKTIEVLKELIEKLTSEEQTKEKVCEEVCREVCP